MPPDHPHPTLECLPCSTFSSHAYTFKIIRYTPAAGQFNYLWQIESETTGIIFIMSGFFASFAVMCVVPFEAKIFRLFEATTTATSKRNIQVEWRKKKTTLHVHNSIWLIFFPSLLGGWSFTNRKKTNEDNSAFFLPSWTWMWQLSSKLRKNREL